MDRNTVMIERRRAPRRVPASGEPIARVRLRTGPELIVVDVSDAGALVQGSRRLLPGTRLDLHVIAAAGRVLVRSRVIRAFVSQLRADAIQYRGAVLFDHLLDTSPAGYLFPAGAHLGSGPQGTAYPAAGWERGESL